MRAMHATAGAGKSSPLNANAFNNIGAILAQQGRWTDAIVPVRIGNCASIRIRKGPSNLLAALSLKGHRAPLAGNVACPITIPSHDFGSGPSSISANVMAGRSALDDVNFSD